MHDDHPFRTDDAGPRHRPYRRGRRTLMRRSIWPIPVAVFAVGCLLTIGTGLNLEREAKEANDIDLAAEADEIGQLLEGLAGGFEASLVAVAGIGLVTDGDVAVMSRYVETSASDGVHGFVDLNASRPTLLALANTTSSDQTVNAETRDGFERLLDDPEIRAGLADLREAGGGFSFLYPATKDVLAVVAVATDGQSAFAGMQRFPLGAAGLFLTSGVGQTDDVAIYLSAQPDADTAIIATTPELPLRGRTAETHIQVGDQLLTVQVSGTIDRPLPTSLVVGIGLVISAALAGSLLFSLRRRDAAVEALRAAHDADRQFRAALDASPDAVFLGDLKTGAVSLLNDQSFFDHHLGDDATFADFVALFDEDHADALRLVLEGEDNVGIEASIHRADGSQGWTRVRVSRTDRRDEERPSDDLDLADLVVIVVTDITEARVTESQRAQLEADLNQAQRMETIGQLAGGIAHDFNNLLAAISSTAELLASDITDPEMARDVQEILAATHRGATLTKRLLTFSRRGVSSKEVVDVGTVTTALGDLLRRMLDERIELQIETADDSLLVQGDAGEIEQILLNLVVNARDASKGPGHLIRVRTEAVGGNARITVSDNGVGMPAEIRERAFEPFFTTKDADRGTGLGLSIVYGIASRMEGSVHIESVPGEGTSVVVDLPLQLEGEDAVSVDLRGAEVPTFEGAERVLLVEDEPAVCRAAQRLLEKAGHLVRTAKDGREAIDVLEDGFTPTVLVTDVILPGPLTGRDIADRARALYPGIRVVYASGYPRDVVTSDLLIEEHIAFVAKPFTSHTLLAAVSDHEEVPS